MNVDELVTDFPTIAQRVFSKKPPDQGGWSFFCTGLQGTDALTPATNRNLRGNAQTVGWPNSPKIEALRDRWLDTSDVATQRNIAAEVQAQAFVDVALLPTRHVVPHDNLSLHTDRHIGRPGNLLERPAAGIRGLSDKHIPHFTQSGS